MVNDEREGEYDGWVFGSRFLSNRWSANWFLSRKQHGSNENVALGSVMALFCGPLNWVTRENSVTTIIYFSNAFRAFYYLVLCFVYKIRDKRI